MKQFDRDVRGSTAPMHPEKKYELEHLLVFTSAHVGIYGTGGQKKACLRTAVTLLQETLRCNRTLWAGKKLILNASQPTND